MPGRRELSSVRACETEAWSLAFWKRDLMQAEGVSVAPLLCGSWRCRRCAWFRGAVDWARCSKGISSRPWWLYLVLTFDPRLYVDRWDAYRAAGDCWDHGLRRSLERSFGKFVYLQTWERHRNGWPHCNVVLSGDGLERAHEESGTVRRRARRSPRLCKFSPSIRQRVLTLAERAGFGTGSLWCEVIDTTDGGEAMANYLVKLAKELTGAAHKKGCQAPIDAPRHFRRIRASRGLLPAPVSSNEWTGQMIPSNLGKRLRIEASGELDAPRREPGQRPNPVGITFARFAEETLELERRAREDSRSWARSIESSPLEIFRGTYAKETRSET